MTINRYIGIYHLNTYNLNFTNKTHNITNTEVMSYICSENGIFFSFIYALFDRHIPINLQRTTVINTIYLLYE